MNGKNYQVRGIFLSATPAKYETENSGNIVELVVRPTGLTDPEVDIRPATHQVDDLQEEIKKIVAKATECSLLF